MTYHHDGLKTVEIYGKISKQSHPILTLVSMNTVKPVLSGYSKKEQKLFFKTDYRLMQVKSIAECSKRASCNTFDLHKLPSVFKTFVLSIFEWPLNTGFAV